MRQKTTVYDFHQMFFENEKLEIIQNRALKVKEKIYIK